MSGILIVEDSTDMAATLARIIKGSGHEARMVHSLEDARSRVREENPDIVLLDLQLPDGNSLDLLPVLRELLNPPEVIVLTGHPSDTAAEVAMREGVWDFLLKPSSPQQVRLSLKRALEYRGQKNSEQRPVVLTAPEIVGHGPEMKKSRQALAMAAGSEASVLITGETGTGKELFSRAIHENSKRSKGPFITVDCAALPRELGESILFGHEKSAFTGAEKKRPGLVREAHGGTLFLDEVGELPADLQKVFLRVLQEKRYRPVGQLAEETSDFRLIAATNRNPDAMVKEGRFRADLLYRLRAIHIEIPPLRRRLEDMRELVLHHLDVLSHREQTQTRGFSPDFLEALSNYDWPGNIRELVQALEKSWAAARDDGTLYPLHLPVNIRVSLARAAMRSEEESEKEEQGSNETGANSTPRNLPEYRRFREAALKEAESQYFRDLIAMTNRDISEACRISGLSRARLYSHLKRHNLSRGNSP